MMDGNRPGPSARPRNANRKAPRMPAEHPAMPPALPPAPRSFDDALGRRIVDLHVWAVRLGLLGTAAETLFDGFCQRLVIAGVPLWRAFAGMRTLHPQWAGYGYTWRRDLNAIQPAQWERGGDIDPPWRDSPFAYMMAQSALASPTAPNTEPWLQLRRRLVGPDALLDFPVLAEFAAAGATDYFAQIVRFGTEGDPSRGTGVAYSFTTRRPEGFGDDDLTLLQATLPALSLAIMSHAGHTIAAGLLAAYLGGDAGRRVHAGAVERGSVESIDAVLWFADLRGFTALADASPGLDLIELLDEMFETLTAALRPRGGEVLKFLGDGMLAIFPVATSGRAATCRAALDAAAAAMQAIAALNLTREAAGKRAASVDVALHLGEVLYGNVGAADRLDFTAIGPAVNLAVRLEGLTKRLGRPLLMSSDFAHACRRRLVSLGFQPVKGISEPEEVFGLPETSGEI